jgi:methylenetetrahydrofolate dehydrogenase (NADP+)/methenyltetrahydrofolate cyclohydrolase
METRILDGKQIARDVREEIKTEIEQLRRDGYRAPKMVVILVGEDPASQVYVNNKGKACGWVGMESETCRLPETTSEEELLERIARYNVDPEVNGILVQLPLPAGMNEERVIHAIAPEKDVDGFHPINVGKLTIGDTDGFVSCTPAGIIQILKRSGIELEGKHCVVAGRSNIVGKPMALLLLRENATVTVCHSRTKNLRDLTKQADVFIAAVGKPEFFDAEDIRDGAVVIDVGIHRREEGLCGDVRTASCMGKAAAITPVPGGVGPMTIAMLLRNCLEAFKRQNQIKEVDVRG